MRLLLIFTFALGISAQNQEQVMAERLAAEIERNSVIFDDPKSDAYLDSVVRQLRCAPDSPITVKVIVADSPDAFVSFGGNIYLHTGLLHRAANEAELAGVLAHLIAYNGANRPRPAGPGGLMILPAYSYRNGIPAAPLAMQAEARTAMREADARAVQCLHESNYDPDAYLDAIGHFDAERYQAAAAAKTDLTPRPEYVLDRAGFADLRARLPRPTARRGARQPPSLARPHRNEDDR